MTSKAYLALLAQAHVHLHMGRMDAARDDFHQALRIGPANAGLLQLLSVCCFESNHLDQAIAHARSVLALQPEDATAHCQLGMMLLLLGQADPGWQEYGWRSKGANTPMPSVPAELRAWKGEPLEGRSIMLTYEQGFGDVIQMARYAPLLVAAGARVVQNVNPPLRRLFARQAGFGTILMPERKEKVATYAYLMDLPHLFGHSPQGPVLDDPASQKPYIAVDAAEAAEHFGRAETGQLRVGIAWAGSANHGRDRFRSVPLQQWQGILDAPGCRFFSLLRGDRDADLAALPDPGRVTSLADGIEDFLDLALAIETMDLVITVDTAVAHLAGAMGKPTWVLLNTPPDWRWGLQGATTGWYPSMRLFRQQQPTQWQPVLDQVQAELRQRAQQR